VQRREGYRVAIRVKDKDVFVFIEVARFLFAEHFKQRVRKKETDSGKMLQFMNASMRIKTPTLGVVALLRNSGNRIQSSKQQMRMFSSAESGAIEIPANIKTVENPLAYVERHGAGDGVVVLDVGGKDFRTLRSTIALNPVLAAYVVRAERNSEVVGEKVFVDRDPIYFGLILNHLRNQAEGLSHEQYALRKVIGEKSDIFKSHVQLPTKDPKALRDIFMEAQYFQIPELQGQICGANSMAQIAAFFSGAKSNPFDLAAKIIASVRNALVVLGSAITAGLGVAQTPNIVTMFRSPNQDSKKSETVPQLEAN